MRHLVLITVAIILTFTSLAQAPADTTACPCCTEYHRQFDFWVGDWNAYRPDGNLAGTNHITLIQDSCILRENWKSAASAFTGTSYNYFDTGDSTWNQLWIDNQGSQLILKGRFTGSAMVMHSDTLTNASGQPYVNRITWSPGLDGTVRQLWETKTQHGEWTVVFDGMYRRKRD